MFSSDNLRSPLGRARGLGSAKDGLHHWWAQRLTAIALVPLSMWFLAALIALAGTGHQEFVSWFADPIHATLMILFLAVTFHHTQLGVQVVIEDYVASHGLRLIAVVIVKFTCYGLATLSIVSVLLVNFGGS